MTRPQAVVLFLIGVIAGALGHRLAGRPRRHPPQPARIVARLTRQLGLDAEQQKKALAVFTEEQARLGVLRDKARLEFEDGRKRVNDSLTAILREDQKTRFEVIRRRWDERHKRAWGGPPPPP
jgi:hypothetical protein